MAKKKSEKIVKAKGAPGIFKKTYPEKKFQKKILKWIYIKEYKEFLQKLFVRDTAGNFRLKEEFSRRDLKKLKQIAKTLRQNKGGLQGGKVILAGVLVLLILGFNFLFKDILLERGAEQWLEGIFGARAELAGLKFDPLGGRIRFKELAVADQDQPMQNLIELGSTEIFLHTPALLKGRVVINNLECRSIRWNTSREYSGALVQAAGSSAENSGQGAIRKDTSSPAADTPAPFFSFDLDSVDIPGIIASQEDKSVTLRELAVMQTSLEDFQDKWSGVTSVYKQELESLASTVLAVKNLSVSGIKNVSELASLYTQVESATSDVNQLESKLKSTKTDFLTDLDSVKAMQGELNQAIKSDYKMLRSFISLPEGNQQAVLAALAGEYLREKLGLFYTYGIKMLSYLQKLKVQKEQETEEAGPGNSGVDVYFPSRDYPGFWLKQAVISFGDEKAAEYLAAEVQNISSDPELSGQPVSFEVKKVDSGQQLVLSGLLDPRQQAERTFEMNFQANRFPLYLEENLDFLGVRSLGSIYTFHTNLSLSQQGLLSGEAELVLEELKLQLSEASQLIAREFAAILTSASQIIVAAEYTIASSRQISLDASTNLDDLVARRIGTLIDEKIREAEAGIEKAFDDFIALKLQDNQQLYGALQELETALDGNLSDITSYRNILTQKEKQLASLQKSLEDAAKAQLQKASDEAKDKATDALKNQLDKINPF